MNLLRTIYGSFLEVLAPSGCIVCKGPVNKGSGLEYLCTKCHDKLPYAPKPSEVYNRLIGNFEKDELAISSAISLFDAGNDDYMQLIYSLKYYGFTKIGMELGRELGKIIKSGEENKYDHIVPVPIHHARRRERGYNQSEFIAQGISEILNSPVNFNALKRYKYTQTQTVLSKDQRKTNVKNVIGINKKTDIRNSTILLVDDVLTTGSTLNSCAEILLEHGVNRVDAATLGFAN